MMHGVSLRGLRRRSFEIFLWGFILHPFFPNSVTFTIISVDTFTISYVKQHKYAGRYSLPSYWMIFHPYKYTENEKKLIILLITSW
jgi:hypothetical protein